MIDMMQAIETNLTPTSGLSPGEDGESELAAEL
jgi:hypothetical protein